jgi:hypothetical protein
MFIAFIAALVWPQTALARQPAKTTSKKSPAEIAAASRDLAEKNESCRRRAKEEKLTGLKRLRFIRECAKSN